MWNGIVSAPRKAKSSRVKLTFINLKTVIGLDSEVAGDALSHGAALGEMDVAKMKRAPGFDSEQHFVALEDVGEFFTDLLPREEELVQKWKDLASYREVPPQLAEELEAR